MKVERPRLHGGYRMIGFDRITEHFEATGFAGA